MMQRLCISPAGWWQVIRNHSVQGSALTNAKINVYKSKVQVNDADLLHRILNVDVSSQLCQQTSVSRTHCFPSTVFHRLAAVFKQSNSKKKDGRFLHDVSLWFTGVLAVYGGILSHKYLHREEEDKCPLRLVNKDDLLHIVQHAIYADHVILAINSKNSSIPKLCEKDSSDKTLQISVEKLDEAIAVFEEVSDECCGSLLNKCAMEYRKDNKYKKAFELFKSASDYGHVPSIYNLGLCYEYGHGVEMSIQKAADYYNEAANKGHVKSMFNIATFHYERQGWLTDENGDVGFLYMKKAADQGLTQAQLFVALKCSEDGNWSEAFKYFKMAADQKDRISMFNLAVCFENGFGVAKDVSQAMKYYHHSGEMGDALSQFHVADSYQHGLRGVNKDLKESLKWFKLAYNNGHPDAERRVEEVEDIITKEKSKVNHLDNKYIFSFLNLSKSLVKSKRKEAYILPPMENNWSGVDSILSLGE